MATEVEIVNRALTKLGANRITSLSDNTKEAREANAMFSIVRQAELRANIWRFSILRIELFMAPSPPTPAYGYTYAYEKPGSLLRLIQVGDYYPGAEIIDYANGETAPYAFEGEYILSNEGDGIFVRYVQDVTDTTKFDALFVEAFACKLAMELAEPITASDNKRERATREYREALMTAVRTNAVEAPPQKIADDTWMLVRL